MNESTDKLFIFSKNLRELLRKKNMNVRELSEKSQVPAKTLYQWTAGTRPGNLLQVYKVAKVLSVTIENLMFGDSPQISNDLYELVLYRVTEDKLREKVISLTEGKK